MVIQKTPTKIDKIVSLKIGQRGENLATDIKMDVSDWVAIHPDAHYHCLFKRPGEVQVLPVLSSFEDGILTWTVRAWECGVIGVGYLEVMAVDSDTGMVAKSRVIPCSVEDSIIDDEGPVPPEMSWVEEVIEAKNDAEVARDEAQEVVAGAIGSIEAAGEAQVGAVNSAGATQVDAVQDKGEEVLDSIPDNYSALSGDVSDLKRTIGIENDRTNRLLGLINYGYDIPVDLPAGTTASTRLAVKRNGTHVLLDGTTSPNGHCIVKLNNDVQRVSTNAHIDTLTNGTRFTEGHTYRVNMDVISGTAPSISDLMIVVYKGGSHGNIATRVTGTEHHDCCEFTADGSSYMICVWTNKDITLTDLQISVTMQDMADKSVYDLIDDAVNNLTVPEGTAWN